MEKQEQKRDKASPVEAVVMWQSELIKFREDIVKQVQDIVSAQSIKNDNAWFRLNSDIDEKLRVTLPKILNESMPNNSREHIAALAMQAMISGKYYSDFNGTEVERCDGVAVNAVKYADALLKALYV